MPRKFLTMLAIALVLKLAPISSYALVMLSFEPTPANVSVNDAFSVDLIADIPAAEAVNHWGLDLAFDTSVLSLDSFTKAPIWSGGLGLCSFDGDEICGNAMVPSVSGISTLGTFNFTAVGVGSTVLDLSVTAGDSSEGFYLSAFGIPIGVWDWDYTAGLVNVEPAATVPEPAIFILMVLGLAGLGFARRKA